MEVDSSRFGFRESCGLPCGGIDGEGLFVVAEIHVQQPGLGRFYGYERAVDERCSARKHLSARDEKLAVAFAHPDCLIRYFGGPNAIQRIGDRGPACLGEDSDCVEMRFSKPSERKVLTAELEQPAVTLGR